MFMSRVLLYDSHIAAMRINVRVRILTLTDCGAVMPSGDTERGPNRLT